MAYNRLLVDKIREHLALTPNITITEKEMFGVLNFLVNEKTCICVSGDDLMLRFNPALQESISEKAGYKTMLMRGKEYKGYCYITPEGFKSQKELAYYVGICLDYNETAKSSKKQKSKQKAVA